MNILLYYVIFVAAMILVTDLINKMRETRLQRLKVKVMENQRRRSFEDQEQFRRLVEAQKKLSGL